MNNTWDLYVPHYVGMDEIFQRLDSMSSHNKSYPPYNLIKHDNANYEIEMALAGFKAEEIEVSTESNILKITSVSPPKNSTVEYIHKGLSKRSFCNTWQLSEDIKVHDVNFEDGLLKVSLEKIIPESQKRTVYNIIADSKKELLLE
tara:strand:- start:5856 stop:6293 length:438 start_codon:yes stop_codon:yes gene_type:complete